MSSKKPLTKDEEGRYIFTLSSYQPVRVYVTKPKLSLDSAAAKSMQLITERGGNHNSSKDWFQKEFGVDNAEALFQLIVDHQKQEIENYTKAEVRKSITGQLALRVEQDIPQDMIDKYLKDIPEKDESGQELSATAQDTALEISQQRAWQDALRDAALLAYANHENIRASILEVKAFEEENADIKMSDPKQTLLIKKSYEDIKSKSKIRIL